MSSSLLEVKKQRRRLWRWQDVCRGYSKRRRFEAIPAPAARTFDPDLLAFHCLTPAVTPWLVGSSFARNTKTRMRSVDVDHPLPASMRIVDIFVEDTHVGLTHNMITSGQVTSIALTFKNGSTKERSGKLVTSWNCLWKSSGDIDEFYNEQSQQSVNRC